MDISTVLQALINKTSNLVHLGATPAGSLLVTPYGLPYSKWVAENKGWKVQESSLVAGVVAPPTTTAGLTLQNAEPTTGKWYVIHSVFAAMGAAAAGALESWYISYAVGANKVVAVTGDITAASIKPMLGGGGTYQGMALVDLAATVVDDLWSPLTNTYNTVINAQVAASIVQNIEGAIILKPGSCLSLKGVSMTTGVTLRLGIKWFEIEAAELM